MTARASISLLALLWACAACSSQKAVIAADGWCKQGWLALTGRVVDKAELLPADSEAALTAKLASHEQRTRHQIVIVTTPSLQGKPIETYSLCLARHWGIGRKGMDDGVMLLVAPNERKVRIEVGYGLEAALKDEEASQIIQDDILPAFLTGDFAGGIIKGADALMKETN